MFPKIFLALALLTPYVAMAQTAAEADSQATVTAVATDDAGGPQAAQQTLRDGDHGPGGDDHSEDRCRAQGISTGQGLFTLSGLPGWCDMYPYGGRAGSCTDYSCCQQMASSWCQNAVIGCSWGEVRGGGPGVPGYIYCY